MMEDLRQKKPATKLAKELESRHYDLTFCGNSSIVSVFLPHSTAYGFSSFDAA